MLKHIVIFKFACIASVLCQSLLSTTTEPKGPFDVRLVDGPSEAEGRLEVLIDNKWGTVCDSSFSTFHGDLACKQLGYDGALYVNKSAAYGPGPGPTEMSIFDCKGSESFLWQCNNELHDMDNCSHEHAVGVGCFNLKDGEIPIRFYNHPSSFHRIRNEGTIEVFYNGSWGFICKQYDESNWGLEEADVACKDMGYKRATSAYGGYVSDPEFAIFSVQCRGKEDNLAGCDITATDRYNNCKDGSFSIYFAAAVLCSKTEGVDLSSGKIGGIVMICIISIIMFITIPVLIFVTRKRKQAPEQPNQQEVTPMMHEGTQPYQDIS